MIRRYPCQAVILSVLGIIAAKGVVMRLEGGAGEGGILMALCASAAALALAGIWVCRETLGKKRLRQAAMLSAAFLIGTARMHSVSAAMERHLAGISDGQEVAIQGRVIKKQWKETQASFGQSVQWTVYLTDSYLKTSYEINEIGGINEIDGINGISKINGSNKINRIQPCGNVIVYLRLSAGGPVIGNTMAVSGTVQLFKEARNEGNFDERAYYQDQGYSFKIYAEDGTYQAVDTHVDRLREFLYQMQQSLRQAYESAMPEKEAGALCAMLAGEKSLLDGATKELYRQSGIAHILVVSGLHISMAGTAVFRLLRKRGISYGAASSIAMGVILMFALMTGMGLSAIRAVVMFGIYLGAACCGRAYDSVNGMAVAAACILFWNPGALFLAGFQFSFAAVAGVLFGREICRLYRPKLRLTETVMASFGIQMLTLPLTAWYYYEVPVYSILVNMLVLPLMELMLILGLLGGGLGVAASAVGSICGMPSDVLPLSAAGSICSLLSDTLLFGCTLALKYFAKASEFFLGLPGAVYVSGQPKGWQMAGYCLGLAIGIWMLVKMGQRKGVPMGIPQQNAMMRRKQKSAAVVSCLACLCLLFVRLPKQAEVVMLDVGQGDGIYIHTSDGLDVFIDGGSSDVRQAGAYRILPFLKSRGIGGIDYWFVSHLDQDHISGLKEAAESGYHIGQAVLAKGVLRDEAYGKLMDLLSECQIQVQYLGAGSALRGRQARFQCLAPEAGEALDGRNASSMVLLYEDQGFSGFFSGDISAKEEAGLLAAGGLSQAAAGKATVNQTTTDKTAADGSAIDKEAMNNAAFNRSVTDHTTYHNIMFYKAAHHGSKYSNSWELLEQLKPAVSAVSCAADNDYGHPGQEAVINMEKNSGKVCYTMHSGQIRVCWEGGVIKIWEYLKKEP